MEDKDEKRERIKDDGIVTINHSVNNLFSRIGLYGRLTAVEPEGKCQEGRV